jgi:hypothetical protein
MMPTHNFIFTCKIHINHGEQQIGVETIELMKHRVYKGDKTQRGLRPPPPPHEVCVSHLVGFKTFVKVYNDQ